MTFRQFALNNVRRNSRAYLAYLLSSTFSVMIFFAYACFIFHPHLTDDVGKTVKGGMEAAEYILYGFSILFIFYSVGSFLKARNLEFGLLTIMGSSASQIRRLIFFENVIIGFISTITGIVMGMVLSKGFYLLAGWVMDIKAPALYFPGKATLLTAGAFLLLFLFVSLLTPALLGKVQVITLLQGTQKPKKEPKASMWLVLLSFLSIGSGYYLTVTQLPKKIDWFIPIVALFALGTYFLFSQLSVYMIRKLQRNKRFYWRGVRLIWLSDLAYKMKDNARLFFLVTLIFTVAFSAIGGILVLDTAIKNSVKQNFSLVSLSFEYDKNKKKQAQMVSRELKKAGVTSEGLSLQHFMPDQTLLEGKKGKDEAFLNIVKESEFNRAAKLYDQSLVKLKEKEVLLLQDEFTPEAKRSKKLHFKVGKQEYSLHPISEKQRNFISTSSLMSVAVVDDDVFEQATRDLPKNEGPKWVDIYRIPSWTKTPSSDASQIQWMEKMHTKLGDEFTYALSSPGWDYRQIRSGMGAMFFIGGFIAVIFTLASASFLYFRLFTELNQNKRQYQSLSKIGMTKPEMKRSMTIQIILMFFIPFAVAAVHTIVGMNGLTGMVKSTPMFEGISFVGPISIGIGSFLFVQLVYFTVVRNRYVVQISRVLVNSGK